MTVSLGVILVHRMTIFHFWLSKPQGLMTLEVSGKLVNIIHLTGLDPVSFLAVAVP
jgi:hypothetical protein